MYVGGGEGATRAADFVESNGVSLIVQDDAYRRQQVAVFTFLQQYLVKEDGIVPFSHLLHDPSASRDIIELYFSLEPGTIWDLLTDRKARDNLKKATSAKQRARRDRTGAVLQVENIARVARVLQSVAATAREYALAGPLICAVDRDEVTSLAVSDGWRRGALVDVDGSGRSVQRQWYAVGDGSSSDGSTSVAAAEWPGEIVIEGSAAVIRRRFGLRLHLCETYARVMTYIENRIVLPDASHISTWDERLSECADVMLAYWAPLDMPRTCVLAEFSDAALEAISNILSDVSSTSLQQRIDSLQFRRDGNPPVSGSIVARGGRRAIAHDCGLGTVLEALDKKKNVMEKIWKSVCLPFRTSGFSSVRADMAFHGPMLCVQEEAASIYASEIDIVLLCLADEVLEGMTKHRKKGACPRYTENCCHCVAPNHSRDATYCL